MDLPRFSVAGASPFRKLVLLIGTILLLGGMLLGTALAGVIFANGLCANCRPNYPDER